MLILFEEIKGVLFFFVDDIANEIFNDSSLFSQIEDKRRVTGR